MRFSQFASCTKFSNVTYTLGGRHARSMEAAVLEASTLHIAENSFSCFPQNCLIIRTSPNYCLWQTHRQLRQAGTRAIWKDPGLSWHIAGLGKHIETALNAASSQMNTVSCLSSEFQLRPSCQGKRTRLARRNCRMVEQSARLQPHFPPAGQAIPGTF